MAAKRSRSDGAGAGGAGGAAGESDLRVNLNLIGGAWVPSSSGESLDIVSPVDGTHVGSVTLSNAADVDAAVKAGQAAFPKWSSLTIKHRTAIMLKYHALVRENADELARLVVQENGKNFGEALASVAKGNETVEYACSLPQLAAGRILQVSRGVTCHEVREPIGVVASVCPFNFPAMVPMWTVPIALVTGNCVIIKPSEKVPSAIVRMTEFMIEAGVPAGVIQIVHGQVEPVTALCDHPGLAALTFVGSSRVADIVSKRCHANGKKCLALGGAKNHLVALPDCNADMAAQDIVASFSGCAGQRCMAASALLVVGENPDLMDRIIARAGALKPGTESGCVGAIIDEVAKARILRYIDEAEASGAEILLDGRGWAKTADAGNWVGPTVILHKSAEEAAMQDEIFGPVLSVLKVANFDEAIKIENANPHGNAASIYTSVGAHAEWFSSRFRAGMIGVNIGVPVPREPFSFGGMQGTLSNFGGSDITGDGAMEFFTRRRKITTKWARPAGFDGDLASFDGKM
uniref:Aldehyde dehydrogenase domain-containing protein n=1 Tax=Bicosoecida sp. CB-2014 TaxID=1486930 RepID=A0A7S1CDT3_9STRA|mmetsp:Transcript_23303/g.81222  ORF Transcript_23303/g.81222 Transcript_23303/m.81222 type:complete len:519 (+) Transcript_23303:51-1607(+)|eukprot:CAMPEP_0203813340 /NCGR_PEP_ID=MMETSP0115-20131106/4647_1 /ASSEMBLY_ACC=CAM_ASM_000227 /TAXON_ID=33651 /ORGANISM="Bicosoecid sp, Strain ms1" /LENGTH=518 /DNA_ID=CAMNT_0050722205 /DNA_START=82 /DNA_END=1638 /DNA_ORIENTATION=+